MEKKNEIDKEYDEIIKEYEDLRGEIKQKIELHNSLATFMITTVVAILAFALKSDNSLLYLLPFAIIIPISMRITYFRTALVKISAYIIVYIEDKINGLNWETRNTHLTNINHNNLYNNLTISHYYEGMVLSIVCYALYFFNYVKDNIIDFQSIILLIIPLLLVLWEFVITKRIMSFDQERDEWIRKWKDFKNSN